MRIGFYVNDIMSEEESFTNNHLAMAAIGAGHEAWILQADSFKYDKDDRIKATARHAPVKRYQSAGSYLKELQSERARRELISVSDLDVLFLRSNPTIEVGPRAWAQSIGINFGRIAMKHGVIVVNDPSGLANAMNKMYFQLYPEEVRPRTIITRSKRQIKDFAKEEGKVVLKPLQGFGGQGVFLVQYGDTTNFNQIIDSLTKDGYVIAQEYLPEAKKGDTRLFLMNGQPLKYKGKYAAFRRVSAPDDIRSNIHAGGSLTEAKLTDEMFDLADLVRPKLVQDGMFLVGIDIVGNKIMEINVFNPGGLNFAQKLEGVNFCNAVIDTLERKVKYMKHYQRDFENVEMATL